QVAPCGVAVGIFRSRLDRQARLGHARGVGEREVALVLGGLGCDDLDLARPPLFVVPKRLVAFARFAGAQKAPAGRSTTLDGAWYMTSAVLRSRSLNSLTTGLANMMSVVRGECRSMPITCPSSCRIATP